MAPQPGHLAGATQDQASLRPAKQFVSAEGDQVCARCHALLDQRLCRQPEWRGLQQRAAAQVVDQQQPMLVRQRRQRCQRRHGDKPDLFEVAAVDAQDGGTGSRDRLCKIVAVGPVGGADFDQTRPTLAQDIRDTEATANLDQLAAAEKHLTACTERAEDQVNGRRVVVDHHGIFGAGELAQQVAGVVVAAATPTVGQIVFQVAVADTDCPHSRKGCVRQRGPPQIGVDHNAGRVDERAQPTSTRLLQPLAHPLGPEIDGRGPGPRRNRLPSGGNFCPHRCGHPLPPQFVHKPADGWQTQQAVYSGQLAVLDLSINRDIGAHLALILPGLGIERMAAGIRCGRSKLVGEKGLEPLTSSV